MVNANFTMCYAISVGIWRSFVSGISIVMRSLNLFIKGHMLGFALEGSNEVVVKTIPNISKPADQTKVVSINNLHSKECVGPRNLSMGEHWIKELSCIFRKQKTIVSQGQVAIFDADCFGAYRKSQSGVYLPTTRCYSCDNASKKSAGKNGQLQRDLHKILRSLCEVVGCSPKSAMGMLTFGEFVDCAAQNKNQLYTTKVERKQQTNWLFQLYSGQALGLLKGCAEILELFKGMALNAIQCEDMSLKIDLPWQKTANLDFLLLGPIVIDTRVPRMQNSLLKQLVFWLVCLELDQGHNKQDFYFSALLGIVTCQDMMRTIQYQIVVFDTILKCKIRGQSSLVLQYSLENCICLQMAQRHWRNGSVLDFQSNGSQFESVMTRLFWSYSKYK